MVMLFEKIALRYSLLQDIHVWFRVPFNDGAK